MSRGKQGRNAGRRERHQQAAIAAKARKRLRQERAAIHCAMTEAARMVRSKRKGTRDFEQNMRTLGFVPLKGGDGGVKVGRQVKGDVTAKYARATT